MISVYPDFFDSFYCKAADCRHSCCEGWEIDVDEETAGYYRMKPGELGEELASSMYEDEEGSHFMMTETMRCPFLRDDGLCRIVMSYGEESLCDVCALHPRFYYDYGEYELCGLGLSCEKTCELLWESDEPLTFIGYELSDGDEAYTDEDDGDVPDEMAARGESIFSFEEQKLSYEPGTERDYMEKLLKLYAKTDPIDGDWLEEISELLDHIDEIAERVREYRKSFDKKRYDRLYHYILYRQLERNRTMSKDTVLTFAQRAMDFIFLTDALWGDTKERIRRFSEQIEYSEENTALLYG